MAVRHTRRFDALPAPADVATLGYDGLVAAKCAAADHLDTADDFNAAATALQPLHRAMVARLEALAELDPRVVGWVAAAVARRHPGRRTPGDLAAAESALALAAIRASSYPTESGHVGRGPFRELSVTSTINPQQETHQCQ